MPKYRIYGNEKIFYREVEIEAETKKAAEEWYWNTVGEGNIEVVNSEIAETSIQEK